MRDHCFDPISHVTADDIWNAGLSDKPDCTHVHDALAEDLINRRPGSRMRTNRMGDQALAPILRREKEWPAQRRTGAAFETKVKEKTMYQRDVVQLAFDSFK